MAGQKTIFTRIALKNDTQENWDKAVNFIPLDGEVIIYDADENYPTPRMKVGDGVTTIGDLPFVGANYTVENKILSLS